MMLHLIWGECPASRYRV